MNPYLVLVEYSRVGKNQNLLFVLKALINFKSMDIMARTRFYILKKNHVNREGGMILFREVLI